MSNRCIGKEDIADLKTTDSLPGEFPYVRGTRADNEWLIRQNISVDDLAGANAKSKRLVDERRDVAWI